MPMELRKRKAPAAPPPPPPAPKRKATAPKKEKKTDDVPAAEKPAEKKATAKKAAPPKKGKTGEKAEVTTEAPSADPEVLPEAPAAESSKAKPAAKPKAVKETKETKDTKESKATKSTEPAKKEEKPKEEKSKEKKAAGPTKEKKEAAEKSAEKAPPKAKSEKASATPAEKSSKATEEKKTEPAEKKEKKSAAPKASSSKSATATPAPAAAIELKPGDAIPTGLPELSNQAGEKVNLNALLDASKTGVVLFAYPAASTPGCTKQANLFNVSKDNFEAQGYSIFGLSGDKPEKNAKFKESQKLTYPLLSDVTYELHVKFGIAKPGGKGTLRSVVVISKDGKIVIVKKAGPDETLKAARTACGLPDADAKTKAVEKAEEKKEAAESSSKQAPVEEAPDASA
ncbi:hypothetical protein H072_9235 [Dactylellina haptotyla CBS 200.50]|uniref:thioredoxin-dependent peroxiredoxin n=1 Tax=Dactylellina haptotyla (strain CBS 200.50) TaxID=1284197 RepID=S8A2C5_DACHA|nr:hypothetical protein H072_9235 [Dactylellina haptotyla CBS 200.50]